MDPDTDFASGCSCSVTNAKDEFLIVGDLVDKAPVTVKINGGKKELKWISSTEKNTSSKKGDTFSREYGDGNLKSKLNYKTTFVCPKDSDSCEVTRYSVDANLESGKKKLNLKGLQGECGC